MKTILESATITNLAELERFCEMVRDTFAGAEHTGQSYVGEGETTYVKAPNTTLRMALVKERLSDGSFVYDIAVTETPANAPREIEPNPELRAEQEGTDTIDERAADEDAACEARA